MPTKLLIAILLNLMACLAVAQRVEIVSLATTSDRFDWVSIAVPSDLVPEGTTGGVLLPRNWPAVVGRRLGDHTVLVHVFCNGIHPGERVSGELALSDQAPVGDFSPDGWVVEEECVPFPYLIEDQGSRKRHWPPPENYQRDVVHEDAAERVVRYQGRMDDGHPVFWRAYLYQYSASPVVRWDFQIVHSSSESPDLYWNLHRARIQTKAYHGASYGRLLGAQPVRWSDASEVWETNVLQPAPIADGVRPAWEGQSYGMPALIPSNVWLDKTHPMRRRLATLVAATEGPLVGCVAEGVWQSHWLGLRGTPPVPQEQDPWEAGDSVAAMWRAFSSGRRDYWAVRPLGMSKYPGTTGAQANHGVTRGGEIVSTGNPKPLDGYFYRITSHLRPTGFYTPDMLRVTKASHPSWATWTNRTHVLDANTETLGKGTDRYGQVPRPSTSDWVPQDEQHYGHLELCSYYALTGRMWARELMDDITEAWLAAYHDGAGRALGRTWLDMISIYRLTGDDRIPAHIAAIYDNGTQLLGGRPLAGWQDRIPGPVKAYPRFTDPRALRDQDGNAVPCVVNWQIGLMTPGLIAVSRQMDHAGILQTAADNVSAQIQCGWFLSDQPGKGWLEVDYWAFREGRPTTEADYGLDGNEPGRTQRTGWFGDWVRYSTEQGVDLLSGDLEAKARQIVAGRYSGPPSNWTAAQWTVR